MSYRSGSARDVNEGEGEGTTLANQIERAPYALTVRELMAFLQVSDQTIYRMIRDLTIPFFLVRGSYRFDPKKIAAWLRKRSMNVA